jgi:invasion protein IalB
MSGIAAAGLCWRYIGGILGANMKYGRLGAAAGLGMAGVFGLDVGPAPAQVPTRISATYEDWTVSCSKTADTPKFCEMAQIETLTGQSSAVGQISIGRPAKDGPLKLVIQIPPNVWIDAGLKFTFDDKEPALPAAFRWCTATRCLAERDLSPEATAKLRKSELGKIEYQEASRHGVSMPVSFKGFGPAFDLLLKESSDPGSAESRSAGSTGKLDTKR